MFARMNYTAATLELIKELETVYDAGEATAIADWIMEHLTGLKKTERLFKKEQALTEPQLRLLHTYKTRLLHKEPVQYVLNEAWFAGMKFYVDEQVLIPRPETEELAEWIISSLRFPVNELSIIDIGTGSGCIAISLKRRLRKARVTAVDVSDEALSVAKKNATDLGADVKFIQLDFQNPEEWMQLSQFDIIVSNPPYIPLAGKEKMNANVVDYEPHLALFVPDDDPLVFYRLLARFAKTHLNEQGYVFAEIHEDLGEAVLTLFRVEGYKAELKKDMQGKDRMVKAWL